MTNRDREMILHPSEWPHLVLPLTRSPKFQNGNCALFAPTLDVTKIEPDKPIEILIGNMFDKLSELPKKTYDNVDALLADGWEVD